ncbi:MAG: hypothetical protein NWQ23_09195 [Yoonia sp.]|nr:hypothetical protein [Yoonia sp.]MDP5085582.1 hypothetical protein [Yoonia sp.]
MLTSVQVGTAGQAQWVVRIMLRDALAIPKAKPDRRRRNGGVFGRLF